jgi:hypothetical protein
MEKEWKNVKFNLFSKYSCYDPLLPHTTSERENVKTTIKAPQAILTISSIYIYIYIYNHLRDLRYYQVYIQYTKIYYSIQYSYIFLYRKRKKCNICCFLSPANFPIIL